MQNQTSNDQHWEKMIEDGDVVPIFKKEENAGYFKPLADMIIDLCERLESYHAETFENQDEDEIADYNVIETIKQLSKAIDNLL